MVGDVLQAFPAALVGGASCAGAARLAAKRNWSVYGQIKTTVRARMGHAVGDKLVFCHEPPHLKIEQAPEGWLQAGHEKWDSDSDSDQSHEEGFDLMI